MSNQITKDQAIVAAKWWSEQLAAPEFNNAKSGNLELAVLIRIAHVPVEKEKVAEFEKTLAVYLEGECHRMIEVDYDPCQVLQDALDAAGVDSLGLGYVLPWKTRMWFEDGGVQVSTGYGVKKADLLPRLTEWP